MKIRNCSIFKPSRRSRRQDPWLIEYGPKDARKRVTASTDLGATQKLAIRLVGAMESDRLGIGSGDDARYASENRKHITAHLSDWAAALKIDGRTKKHIQQMRGYATAVLTATGASRLSEIVASRVREKSAQLGGHAETYNRRIKACRQFCAWCVEDGRMRGNPLRGIKYRNVDADRVRERRAILPDELIHLLATTVKAPDYMGCTGAERTLAYWCVVETGMRSSEARTRVVADLRLDQKNPAIRIPPRSSKSRKQQWVSISTPLAMQLAAIANGRAMNDRFLMLPEKTAKMLRFDLALAEIPYRNELGEVFDFHALRHQTASLMIAIGADLKVVQQQMRHSTMQLTADRYGHVIGDAQQNASGRIGSYLAQYQDDFERPLVSHEGEEDVKKHPKNSAPSATRTRNPLIKRHPPASRKPAISRRIQRGAELRVAPGAVPSLIKSFSRIRSALATGLKGRR